MDRRLFPEPRRPDPDPEQFSRLSLRDDRDRLRPSRDTATPGEEPGSRRNSGAQREKGKVEKVPRGIQALGQDFGDEAAVPRQARNGNIPKEQTERPQAESSEDEEGESRREKDTDLGAPAGIFVGMLRAGGNAESGEDSDWEDWDQDRERDWEDSDWEDWEREPEQGPAVAAVSMGHSPASSALQEEFPAVWARSALDCGLLAEEEALDGAPVPPQRQPRLPPHVERRMAELLREYLREGIVLPASSRSNNALLLQRKAKGRGWRLSLDCRALNAASPAGASERPDRARILASIHPRSRFFSVLDFCSACLAVPLARSSWPRFAFTFRGRQFVFTRLPPGFRGTNSIVQRRVGALLARLEPAAAAGVCHYYDDILITGKSRRQAETRTRRVLELIQSAGFKVNPEKAQLVRSQVEYLGVTLGAEGRSVPADTVREICRECDSPGPWDARRLRSVLKKLEARQEFIGDFWELALPLQRLAAERRWEWRREQRERLRRLKEALEAAPVLRFPLRSRFLLLRLSVHAETAGAALLQERAGILLPVGHHSHRLSGRDLSPCDAWLQAAVRAVRAFQTLMGPAPVVIRDPEGNYLLRGHQFVTSGSGSPQSWTLLAASPGPEPRGSQSTVLPPRGSQSLAIPPAPPLGRLPPDTPRANVWFLALEKGLFPCTSVGFTATNLEERSMSGVSGHGSEEDAELEALRELLERHRSRFPLYLYCNRPGLAARLRRREQEHGWDCCGNAWPIVLRWLREFPGMLRLRELSAAGGGAEAAERERLERLRSAAAVLGCVTRSSWIIWSPSRPERQEIVARCHQSRHEDVEGTLARLREAEEHWREAEEDVTRWVRSCPVCWDKNPASTPQRAEGPWSCLRISLSGTLPATPEGFRALLLLQDELSGWLDAFPLLHLSPDHVSGALLRDVFSPLGSVRSVLVPPAPAWLRSCLQEFPLDRFWKSLELSEPSPAAVAVCRAARAAGKGWVGMLPLILAAVRSRWMEAEQLLPLLCVPGLPLEVRWEWPCRDPGTGNELSPLGGMRLLPGHRERVEAALRAEPGQRSSSGTGSRRVCRDWARPDPGSRFARDRLRLRWLRPDGGSGSGSGSGSGIGIGMGETAGLP